MRKKQLPPEPKRRVQLSFTLRKSVNDKFLQYCKDNLLNKSQVIESLMIGYLDSKEFAGMEKHN